MSLRRLVIAVFASVLMLPVSCTVVMVPTMRLLMATGERDLRAGETAHLPPSVAMASAAAPDAVEFVPLAQMEARRRETPGLSAWLATPDGIVGENEDRHRWRTLSSSADRREMELIHAAENYTHTFRYAVTPDGAVTPLRSTLFSIGQMFAAIPVGMAVALLLLWLARRARKRMRATPPPL